MNNKTTQIEKNFLDLSDEKISPIEIAAALVIIAERYQPKSREDIYFHPTRRIKLLLTSNGGIIKIFFCSSNDNCDVTIVSTKSISITISTRGERFCEYIQAEVARVMPQIECLKFINPAA